MQLIVLAGLLSLEKITLALELAQALPADSITLLDGTSRMAFPKERLPQHVQYRYIVDDSPQQKSLMQGVAASDAKIALWLTPESLHPDALFMVLDQLETTNPTLQTTIVSLADDRTCDCFPHLTAMLEDNANLTLRPPFKIEDILAIL